MVVGNVKTKLVVKMATRIFLKYFIYVVIAVVAFDRLAVPVADRVARAPVSIGASGWMPPTLIWRHVFGGRRVRHGRNFSS